MIQSAQLFGHYRAVRPENSMAVGFPDAGVGPGGNPDWNPHTKNGLPWSVGNHGSPPCDSLESESLTC